MTTYRLYGCDAAGKIQFGDFVDAEDEAAAKAAARAYLDRYPRVEVWLGKTLLFRLERI